MVIYFGEEVEPCPETILVYNAGSCHSSSGHENALFLSTQRRRMGVQAVENMVKKYARQVTPNKKSPLINCGVLMELHFTKRPVTSISSQTYSDTRMSIQPKNTMQQ